MPTQVINQYKQLGDALLKALGPNRSQAWLAQQTYVSQEAVHYWLAGQCRPRPERLGHLAALLQLDPQFLTELAEYDDDPKARDKVFAAHSAWCSLLSK
jgi:hypothetical protein